MNASLRRASRDYGLPVALFVAVWIGMLASRSGVGETSIFPVLDSFALLGLLALGIGVTMIAGELDLSIASMAALMGIVAVKVQALGLFGALAVATAAGLALGATQGYAIARLRIHSVVFTIGTLILFRGVAQLFGDQPILISDPLMGDPLLNRTGVLSGSIGIALGVFVLVGLALAFVKPGREIYAVGGDRLEAASARESSGDAVFAMARPGLEPGTTTFRPTLRIPEQTRNRLRMSPENPWYWPTPRSLAANSSPAVGRRLPARSAAPRHGAATRPRVGRSPIRPAPGRARGP